MVSEWRVPCKGQMGWAGLHGTLSNPYERDNVGVRNCSSWHRGPTLTVRLLVLPTSQIISQEFA